MFLCHSTQHQVVKLHCLSLNPPFFFRKSPLSPWKLAVLPSPGVLLEMQHPKSCPCFGAPWACSGWGGSRDRDALGTGSTGNCGLVLVGSRQGVGRNIGQGGQANGEGIRQGNRAGAGGAEPRMSREQAGMLEPAFQAAPSWLCSRFPSCFSVFPVLGMFFFSPSGGKHCRADRGFACYVYFWGLGRTPQIKHPPNQLFAPKSSFPTRNQRGLPSFSPDFIGLPTTA